MMIRSFDILSVGKVMAAMYAFFGLLAGGFFTLISLVGMAARRGGGLTEILFGVGAVIALPIFYGLIGFIGGVLSALFYNLLASAVGGIIINFETIHGTPIDDSDSE